MTSLPQHSLVLQKISILKYNVSNFDFHVQDLLAYSRTTCGAVCAPELYLFIYLFLKFNYLFFNILYMTSIITSFPLFPLPPPNPHVAPLCLKFMISLPLIITVL